MPSRTIRLSPAAANRPSRRRALLAAAALLLLPAAARADAPPPLSASDKALIGRIDAYLNSQSAITAKFLQVANDGSTRTGHAWMERPGRMRFEYDPPDPQLLVTSGGALVYHDPALDQTTTIPLGSTPLGLLLAQHVALDGPDVQIVRIDREPGEIDITLTRKGKAALGSLTLVFGENPIELRQWVVTDAQGNQTRVSLYDIAPAGPLPASLFEYHLSSPSLRRGG